MVLTFYSSSSSSKSTTSSWQLGNCSLCVPELGLCPEFPHATTCQSTAELLPAVYVAAAPFLLSTITSDSPYGNLLAGSSSTITTSSSSISATLNSLSDAEELTSWLLKHGHDLEHLSVTQSRVGVPALSALISTLCTSTNSSTTSSRSAHNSNSSSSTSGSCDDEVVGKPVCPLLTNLDMVNLPFGVALPLSALSSSLQHLRLHKCTLPDVALLTEIFQLRELRTLDLSYSTITWPEGTTRTLATSMQKLSSLDFTGCRAVDDLGALSSLADLKEVWLRGCNTAAAALADLQELPVASISLSLPVKLSGHPMPAAAGPVSSVTSSVTTELEACQSTKQQVALVKEWLHHPARAKLQVLIMALTSGAAAAAPSGPIPPLATSASAACGAAEGSADSNANMEAAVAVEDAAIIAAAAVGATKAVGCAEGAACDAAAVDTESGAVAAAATSSLDAGSGSSVAAIASDATVPARNNCKEEIGEEELDVSQLLLVALAGSSANSSLQQLELISFDLRDIFALRPLGLLTQLSGLSLMSCLVDEEQLMEQLRGMQGLRELQLTGCDVDDVIAEKVGSCLSQLTGLKLGNVAYIRGSSDGSAKLMMKSASG
jgi:hypothetical protein